jgi:ABC-type polar amino acid transport system ATPase subunit
MIVARRIKKVAGNATLLDDINLELKPGSITAIIGPSGSGKTMTLRCLTLVDLPTSGELAINGSMFRFPGVKPDTSQVWPHLTAVFQQLFLWPHLTLFENVALPLRTAGRQDADARARAMLSRVGLDGVSSHYPNEASGGERQRAALARAIALEPRYLFLDEITSSLDVESAGGVLEIIRSLKSDGLAILVVTHSLHFIAEAADAIVFLDHGRIVEAGGPEILRGARTPRLQKFLSIIRATH